MRVRSLWILVIIISTIFMTLKRMYYHINYAVPHFVFVQISNPPYEARVLYSGYPQHWRYALMHFSAFMVLAVVLVFVLQNIALEEK